MKIGDFRVIKDAEHNYLEQDKEAIKTRLVFLAGRFCEFHAGDIFLDWAEVDRLICSGKEGRYIVGFRKFGTLTNESVVKKINDGEGEQFRAIVVIEITIVGNESFVCMSDWN